MNQNQSSDPVINGDVWKAFSCKVHDLADIVWNDDTPSDPLTRAEGARYLLRFLSAGLRVCLELDDTDHPFIDYNIYGRMSWGLDNPDCNYSYARLNPANTYRIKGKIGSAKNLEFQVTTGHHADGQFMDWQSVSALRGSDLTLDSEGGFELIVSSDRAALSGCNSLEMNSDSNFLLIREFFADWENEKPSSFTMEVVNANYPPEPLSTAQVANHFDLLNQWLDLGANCWRQFAAGILANEPSDIVPFLPPAGAAALGGQAYGMGSFQLEKDEAVILEFTPPDCLVWSLSLCDSFFQSIEYEHRQSSLNGHQSVLLGSTVPASALRCSSCCACTRAGARRGSPNNWESAVAIWCANFRKKAPVFVCCALRYSSTCPSNVCVTAALLPRPQSGSDFRMRAPSSKPSNAGPVLRRHSSGLP